jgi:rhodanese-related sulfurtransferase
MDIFVNLISRRISGEDTMWKKMMFAVICMTGLVFTALTGAVYASHDEIPRISIEDLKKMVDQNAAVVILDVQLKNIYDKEHIKGARSFPWKAELSQDDVMSLPKDKLIVTYCECGPGEADSSDVAAQLTELGFSNVKVLADPSLRGWKKAGYPVEK